MPYNKGDFTQQGVNGHVNANVRLNEKRLVNIDMTSNEEAEGCTITGTVTDLLNDKVYNIGSGGGGGGDSDFSTVPITINNPDILTGSLRIVTTRNNMIIPFAVLNGETEQTVDAVLYKGSALFTDQPPLTTVTATTGDITWDSEEERGVISGEGTITIAGGA